MYIEELFDTIFNIGYGRAYRPPPPSWLMRRENYPWFEGLSGMKRREIKEINGECRNEKYKDSLVVGKGWLD